MDLLYEKSKLRKMLKCLSLRDDTTPFPSHNATPQSQHEVEGRLFLDVVVRERPAILQLLSRKYKPLLVRWNTFLVL